MDDRERTTRTSSRTSDSMASDASRATGRTSRRIEERLASFDEALGFNPASGEGSAHRADAASADLPQVDVPSTPDAAPSVRASSVPGPHTAEPSAPARDVDAAAPEAAPAPERPRTASSSKPQRYVRRRTPHRSQGVVDDLTDDSIPSAGYTHDSNITVGGSTPLSGMTYRRARSDIARVHGNTRYGQYLEIPKGRRSIFASRERARRRKSVLALLFVVALLVLAAYFLWNMMQNVLG